MTRLTHPARRLLPGALALAILLAAAFAIVPSAQAETASERDRVRDVVRIDFDRKYEEKRLPSHENTDIKRWRVAYDQDEIRVLMTFRKLVRKGPQLVLGTDFFYPTGGGDRAYAGVLVRAREGRWDGRMSFATDDESERPPATCAGASHDIDYAADRVTITLPTVCVSSPRWIEFNHFAATTDRFRNPSYFYVDTALSKRIYRG